MISANTVWVVIVVVLVVYLVARWVRSHTTTAEDPQVRYFVRSGSATAAQELGARSGLVVSRYYFRQTDIETGPSDAADFYDELFIDLRDPDSGQTWQNSIHVATPRALDRVMQEEQWDSVIGTELLIVRRYDLQKILDGAIEHLQQLYEVQVQLTGRGPTPPEVVG
ncbi:MAG: hypothetical protein ACE14L_04290 [Terriglobales bacterium]